MRLTRILGSDLRKDPALLFDGLNCLLYTSDAADEEDSVDLGGRRIIKKKKIKKYRGKIPLLNTIQQAIITMITSIHYSI